MNVGGGAIPLMVTTLIPRVAQLCLRRRNLSAKLHSLVTDGGMEGVAEGMSTTTMA